MRELYVRSVSTNDLLVHRCRACRHIGILGFWPQVEKRTTRIRPKLLQGVFSCGSCGAVHRRLFRLTTGNPFRPRWCPWIKWWTIVAGLIPIRYTRTAVGLILWLEKHAPF